MIMTDLDPPSGQRVTMPTTWTTKVAGVIRGDSTFSPNRGTTSSFKLLIIPHFTTQVDCSLKSTQRILISKRFHICISVLVSWSRWEGRTLGNPWIASCCECSKASISPAPYHHLLMVFQAWKLIYFMEKTSWQKPARNETSNFCRRFGLFNLLLGHLKLHWWTNKNTYRKMITGSHFIP